MEACRKRVQFTTLFQLVSEGRPIVEYKSRLSLYKLLNVLDFLSTHWCDNSGWVMAFYMYKQVTNEMRRLIVATRYIAISVDEVTTVDNNSYLSVHIYIVQDWVWVLLLVLLECIDCIPNVVNLTRLIIDAIGSGGSLDSKSIVRKLLNFGANGASTL